MVANLLYVVALLVASPLVVYRMVRHGRYRRGIAEKLCGLSAQKASSMRTRPRCVWFHAVSVGEVNLLRRLARQFADDHPDYDIVISSSTDTGYDLAVQHFGQEHVFFCPLDFSWAVNRTLRHLACDRLVLAELELWPNTIRLATNRGCWVGVINGRLSERSASGYQRFSRLTRSTFERLTWVGCQDRESADRFVACGTPPGRVEVTGSLKFDDAPDSRETPEVNALKLWAGIDSAHQVWVVGSTSADEEQLAIDVYQTLRTDFPELRLVIVPRHVERFDTVAELIGEAGLRVHRRSLGQSMKDATWDNDRIILVDTIGELRHWWGVGSIATVGGSFGPRGGQNMLEPAGYGSAVSFGPNTVNFREIADRLLRADAAVRVHDDQELRQFVVGCLSDSGAAAALGRAARQVVASHRGASERTLRGLVTRLLPEKRGESSEATQPGVDQTRGAA